MTENPMGRRAFLKAGAGGAALVVAGCATGGGVSGDGIRNVRAESPELQAHKRAALEAAKELGPTMTDVEVRRTRNIPGKRAAFYLDDVIFVFRDLARERPKSCWNHFLLAAFKEAHEKYGLKAQFNVFFRNDFYYGARGAEFTLRDMPDTWKQEFQAAKDWFRFGFHSYSEFPDYPWINASYDDVKFTWDAITREVERFAGPGMFAKAVTPHWGPMSKDGCIALRDCGVKTIWCSAGKRYAYTGDRTVLPYGHGMRIENFRKPETAMYWRAGGGDDISVSACGYNHLLPEQVKVTHGTYNWLHDRATGCNFMTFGCGAPCLNLYRLEDIPKRMAKVIDKEFLIHATHEEYWFKDYFAYQPDSREKLLTAVKAVHDAGYQYAFIEDKIDWN